MIQNSVTNPIDLSNYHYELPEDRIAYYPLPDRAASKILVYNGGKITDTTAGEINHQLPRNTFIVLNETKVINARLYFKKKTGAVIELFLLKPHNLYRDISDALASCGKSTWVCIIGNKKKWKDKSESLTHILSEDSSFIATWDSDIDSNSLVHFEWADDAVPFAEIINKYGNVPLPPYIQRQVEKEDETRYQTVFAEEEGSVAAPTASLHLTTQMLDTLESEGHTIDKITLHTGAGTFMPVKDNDIHRHIMHDEHISFSIHFLKKWQSYIRAQPEYNLLCVGTTACRTIETIYWIGVKLFTVESMDWTTIAITQWEINDLPQDITLLASLERLINYMEQMNLQTIVTRTQLLIMPGYHYRCTNILMTNFHQPESTLILLVAAFVGERYKEIYDHALNNDYRFLSYGDGSILFSHQNINK